ncbi:MAG: pyruvate dehydrogenase (acetyl-transferring) E1 component subunit alpha [Rubrivivax sp.]
MTPPAPDGPSALGPLFGTGEARPATPQAAGTTLCRQLLQDMLRVRRMEERCAQLYGEGHIRGFLHLLVGQEAVCAGVMPHLRADDHVVGTYREHGHALLRGVPMRALMAEMFGRVEGCCRGRGGSMHLFDAQRRFHGGQAIVGAGMPLAVGLALAGRVAGGQERPDAITAVFFGEGAVAEGAFHEALNLAALWSLPVLFVCENNLYAMGTALSRSQAQMDLTVQARAHTVAAAQVPGMQVLTVHEAARQAVAQVRASGAPVFLELHTYRFRAHSMFDPGLYRDAAEVERWKHHDPVTGFRDRLWAEGLLDEAGWEEMSRRADGEVDDAVAFAQTGHDEAVEDLLRGVVA